MTDRLVAFLVLAALAGLGACNNNGDRNSVSRADAIPGSQAEDGALASADEWQLNSSVDPMTDAASQTAIETVRGVRFDVEASVTCRNDGQIQYTLTSFDKEGHSAEMRSSTGAYDRNLRFISLQVRAGSTAAREFSAFNPPYSNQVTFVTGPGPGHNYTTPQEEYTQQAAASRRLLVRLFMPSGEETIQIDQSGPIVRGVLDPCLAELARRGEIARANAERRRLEQQEQDRREHEEEQRQDPSTKAH